MRISSTLSLFSLLLSGLLSVNLVFPLPARAVQCGDDLFSGGTIVLDQDLTCANPDPDDIYAVGLLLGNGTILDLNGHTISCTGGLKRAIRVGHAQLLNGTIANCEEGIKVSNGVLVEHVVFTHNKIGVYVVGGDGNTFRNNIAVENSTGFSLTLGDDDSGADDNVLINNLATQNSETGFAIGRGRRSTLIGNTASFNGVGFTLYSDDASVSGNVAEANQGPGFKVFGSGELTGNTARQNGGEGFILDSYFPLRLQANLAHANGGDGFFLSSAYLVHRRMLRGNVALTNSGHGIHIEGDGSPKSQVIDNMVVGHLAPFFDLADDNLRCRGSVWRKNTFDTASQACIH